MLNKFSVYLMLIILSGCSSIAQKKEGQKLNQFFEYTHQEVLKRSPGYKAYLGIKEDMDKWDDESEEAELEMVNLKRKWLKEIEQFDFEKLSKFDKVSYRLFQFDMIRDIEQYKWRDHYYPISHAYGPHSDFVSTLNNFHPIENEKMALDYLQRVRTVPEVLEQKIVNIKRKEKFGVLSPKYALKKNLPSLESLLTGFPLKGEGDQVLYNDFKTKLEKTSISKVKKAEMLSEMENLIKGPYFASHRRLHRLYMHLLKIAPSEAGATTLPQGKDFYRHTLKHHTTTDITAPEIHKLGLSEVKRIHGEMLKIARSLGFKGSLQDFFTHVKDNKLLTYPNTKEGKEQYLQDSIEIIEGMKKELPKLFTVFPKSEVVVKAVEPYREKSSGIAFYNGPSNDGTRPGTYYVNLFDMNAVAKYEMEALAYHEAIPGHHMQIALAKETKKLPSFRKNSWFTSYGEGWALYTELIPKEIGLYKDPYSDFGRLSMELWRACRLVVDSGIHHYGWSKDRAVKYLLDNTTSDKHDAETSIIRYTMWPGQATAYKIGMLKILELRKKAKEELGDKFDVRFFHDEILKNGTVPLAVLDEIIVNWIDESRSL